MKTETEIPADFAITRKSSLDSIAQADKDLAKLDEEAAEKLPALREAAADPLRPVRELAEYEQGLCGRRRVIWEKKAYELSFLKISVPAPIIEFEERLKTELQRWSSYGNPSNVADYGRKNRRELALRNILTKIEPLKFSVASNNEAIREIAKLETELANWDAMPAEVAS